MSSVLIEDRGAVRILTLNRPERRNALDESDRTALLEALVTAEREARAIVLTGTAPIFCSGGDISSMTSDPAAGRRRLDLVNAIARQLITGGTPVVVAVEGGAFGLGMSLACAADLVVAGRSARFIASFARLGLVPDTGLTWTLPHRVGRALSRRMLLTAAPLEAAEALSAGLVDELVDDGQALGRAVDLAGELAELSAPMVAALRKIMSQPDQTLEGILSAEADAQQALLGGREFAEGRAAFLERRRPNFAAAGERARTDASRA